MIYTVERKRVVMETFEFEAGSTEEACHLVNTDVVRPLESDVLQEAILSAEPKQVPVHA